MEESEDEVRRRDELIGMYEACKGAIKAISEVSSKTTSTPLPAPVINNSISSNSYVNMSINSYIIIILAVTPV